METGAPRTFSAGRSIGHTANSRSPTARNNMSNSGNTTTTNNTTDNSRAYNDANHNEIKGSTFNFFTNFPKKRVRGREAMEDLVRTQIDWSILSGQLSVVDQDNHRSTISPFDSNEPNFFWITRNIDCTQWKSADTPQALLLSAPHGHGTMEYCSHIISRAKEKASRTNGSVLYFFCSSATGLQCSPTLIHTLLYQVVCCSSDGMANSIAAAFLNALVDGHFLRSQDFREDDPLEVTVKKVLSAPDNELIKALVEAIKNSGIQELSITVDGLQENIAYSLFQLIREATPKPEVLLTTQHQFGEIPHSVTYIEYDKERKECLRFLQHDGTRYDKITEEHHDSLQWLWEHPQYLAWLASTTSSLLYIEGKPGSGKSTLAKYFEKNLVKREPNAHSATVAYYFYTFRGTKLEPTHMNMLRSILYSILEQDESTFSHFQKEFREFRRRDFSEWPYASLKKVLSSFADHPSTKPLYLILDAMDESEDDDRRDVIQLLCRLCAKENPCNIKAFLASRPLAELNHRIQESHQVIRMQDENTGDISRFADDFLTRDLELTGEILNEARDYITKHAQGVFVWVTLVRRELVRYAETGYRDAEIFEVLQGLPRELEQFYQRMLNTLENGPLRDIRDGIRLFEFVLFALRPLTVEELRDALAVPDDPNSCYETFQQNKIREIDRRIEHCGGDFLEIRADGTVQFMHQTVREFLIRTIPHASNLKFDMSEEGANRAITTAVVRYLMLCFTSPIMRDRFSKIKRWSRNDYRGYAEYLNEWPLIDYALRYIKENRNRCGQKGRVLELVTTLVQQLIDDQASYFLGSFMSSEAAWYSLTGTLFRRKQNSIKYNTLNAAAELPELPHAKALLLTCTQDDGHAERKTLLIISAQKGLTAATRLLLDQNVDKDARDTSGRTALHYAAENCDEAIVRLLVEQGVEKNIKDNKGVIPAELAVDNIRGDDLFRRRIFYYRRTAVSNNYVLRRTRYYELPPLLLLLRP